MDRYNPEALVSGKILSAMIAHNETIKFEFIKDKNGEWYPASDIAELAKEYLKLAKCECIWCDRVTYVGNKRVEPELCPIEQLIKKLEELERINDG